MSSTIRPLHKAYSHRDCELKPMLWQSLEQGFTCIEADIYCFMGKVFVAHDLQQLRPWNTLERLYLEPLKAHLHKNNRRVFNDDTTLSLFLDVKTPSGSSYKTLHNVLSHYSAMLTSYQNLARKKGPISIIISGNRLKYAEFASLPHRYAALDGRHEDLGKQTNPLVMPIISDNWQKLFNWQGEGEMPLLEEKKLKTMLELAHKNGQQLRFWATPDKPGANRDRLWEKLLTLGIDLVNTDDVTGLANYLKTKR